MARFIEGINRNQLVLFPESIDDYIDENNEVRFIDAFVDSLDMKSLGFKNAALAPSKKGAPSYDPRLLLKIYLYSYPKKIRSSRRIASETSRNIELMWLTGRLYPDFRTISDFRKDNSKALKNVLTSFNVLCCDLNIFSKELISLDGSKFKAVNSKDNNFTKDKLVDRLKRIEDNISSFLKDLDNNDSLEASDDDISLKEKLNIWKRKKSLYSKLLTELQDSGQNQISLTDKDSKLMKCNGNMLVGYNVQATVDTSSHIITSFDISSDPCDSGKIMDSSLPNKEIFNNEQIEVLVDGGYNNSDDIKNCFENKIIPILPEGVYRMTFPYTPSIITPSVKKGNTIEDVQSCLHAGVIPDCYSHLNLEISIQDSYEASTISSPVDSMNDEQRLTKAKEGFFVRSTSNSVFCPQGHSLKYFSSKKVVDVFKGASFCSSCPKQCSKDIPRVLELAKRLSIQGTPYYKTSTPKHTTSLNKVKIVVLTYIPDKNKYKLRKNTSEHPFGTLKRTHDASYFLTKGTDKVSGEMALSVLGYNFTKLRNIIDIPSLVNCLKSHKLSPVYS